MKNTTVSVRVMDAAIAEDGMNVEIDLEFSGSVQDDNGRVVFSPRQRKIVDFQLGAGQGTPDRATKVGNSRSPMSDPRQKGAI